jgi:poly-gamma-glutamate capsule biosynthesis protein CapA/YwtB (metallophosphatase superfamily)
MSMLMKKMIVVLLVLSLLVAAGLALSTKPNKLIPATTQILSKVDTNKPESKKFTEITIIFGGDLMFDRYIRQIAQSKGYDYSLEDFETLLADADLVVANLEGPITTYDSISVGSDVGSKENYIFTFEPKITETLTKYNIGPVNIGNNHILNFGIDGLNQTLGNLRTAEVGFFGDVTADKSVPQSVIVEASGISIGLVSYNEFAGNNIESALGEIVKLKNGVDVVVAYTHWGPEYVKTAPQYIQDAAHEMISAGADAVIGVHPHVVQQSEDYMRKRIYYSLGNFVMDQYFDEDVRNGMLVKMKITGKDSIEYEEIPIYMDSKGKTVLKN